MKIKARKIKKILDKVNLQGEINSAIIDVKNNMICGINDIHTLISQTPYNLFEAPKEEYFNLVDLDKLIRLLTDLQSEEIDFAFKEHLEIIANKGKVKFCFGTLDKKIQKGYDKIKDISREMKDKFISIPRNKFEDINYYIKIFDMKEICLESKNKSLVIKNSESSLQQFSQNICSHSNQDFQITIDAKIFRKIIEACNNKKEIKIGYMKDKPFIISQNKSIWILSIQE